MATRFYLSATVTTDITPGFAAWTRTSEADRRAMSPTKGSSVMTSKTFWAGVTAAANNSCLNRQYVSAPMSAGIAFTIGDTVKLVLRCMESATNDNINRCPICVKVYSEDGLTLRATLLTLLHYGPNTTEWATSLSSKRAADGDAITAAYTTVAGDRLVVEIGGQVSSSGGTSVTGTQSFGENGASDLLESEGVTTALNPWFEISRNITLRTTYDETAKVQVILATQGRVDTASLLETAKAQTIIAAQGELDGFLFNEMGLAQTILAAQGRSDQVIASETGKLAVMLVAQGRTDTAQMNEAAKLEVVLAVQGHSDALSMAETAKTEIILALQGETDGLLYTETGLSQVILVVQGKADHLTINEIAKLAVILVSQGKTDLMQMTEIAKLEIILVTQGKVDVMTLPELGREQVILALQGHQDTQNMLELTKSQVILAVLSESDVLIPGGIYFGILKRWDGSTWVREPLKVYLVSSWQTKPLKQWVGSEWKKVDITG